MKTLLDVLIPARVRRAFQLAAVVVLAACGSDGDPFGATSKGSIRGNVTDNTGAAVANAGVELTGNTQAARNTTSGPDGSYTFADIAPGTYTLAVTAPTGFTVGTTASTSVTVNGGAEANAAAFVLSRIVTNGSIQGLITNNAGAPVANVGVALTGNGQAARTTTSGANGVYTFANVPPGSYLMVVLPPSGLSAGTAGTVSISVASGAEVNATPFVLSPVTGVSRDSAFVAALRTRLENATATNQFSGAVRVTRNGQTLFEGAYGLADRERDIPNTLQTQFRLGSMTKMLTAVATLQLVQAGKLRLEGTVGTYLPDYPNAEIASKVTIHHLLTHTGGTGDIFGPLFSANRLELREPSDYLRLYGSRAPLFMPGAQFQYSNYGFMLLGAIIERVTGMRYDDYIAANVHTPAGMIETGALPEDSLVPNRAVGYTKQLVPGQLVDAAPTLPYRGTPAGGGYSTVRDFARFAAAIQQGKLLDATHNGLLIGGKIPLGVGEQYAYGFFDRQLVGRRFVGHGGGAAGMNGELVFEPAGEYVVVVLANLDPQAAGQIAGFILGQLLAPGP